MAEELFGEPVEAPGTRLFGEPAPAPTPAEQLFGEPADDEGLGAFGTVREIGRGILSGPVTLAQGVTEFGAAALDLAFDTDYARGVTGAFEGFRDRRGLRTETTPARIADEVTAFGLGFLPIAGWLGRASAAARGTVPAAGASNHVYMRTADAFGRSARGQALLGTRARLAATTALAAGGFEVLTTPEGYGTVSDTFDVMPDFLQTEDASDGITGRADALRRFRNRGRRAAEAAAMSGAVDTALMALPRAAELVVAAPVIGPAISSSARASRDLLLSAAQNVGRVPGAQSTGEFFRRWFSPSGGVDPRLAEMNLDRQAYSSTALRQATDHLRQLDDATNNLFERLQLTGRGRAGVERTQRDVTDYITGARPDALEGYDAAVREAADRMQRLTWTYEEQLLKEIDAAESVFGGGGGPAMRGPGSLGVQKLRRTREALLEQRAAAATQREAVREGREAAGEALKGFEDAQSTYLRRRFERYEAPERFFANMDPKFMESATFKSAVQEVLDNSGEALTTPEAQQKVLHYLGLDLLANGDLTPEQALRQRAKTAAADRTGREIFPTASGINVVESLFDLREPLIDKSPSLRQLMGEVTDPKSLFVHTISDLADTVSNVRFARSLAADPELLKAGNEAVQALSRGGRPMLVDPGRVRGPLPQREGAGGGAYIGDAPGTGPELVEDVLRNYGYRPLDEQPDVTHPFMGQYGSLTGMWAPPEVHDALNMFGRLGQTNTSEFIALAVGAKALSQQMTVVMNPVSQIRNISGNAMFLAGNGNLGRDLSVFDALRLTAGSFADNPQGEQMLAQLGRLGVVDTALVTNQIQAMQRMGRDLNFAGAVQRGMDKIARHVPLAGRLHKFLNRTYSDVDTFFKIANTLAEESKLATTLARAGLDDTNPALRQTMIDNGLAVRAAVEQDPSIPFRRVYAAEVTKDVMPTYNRVPRAVRLLDMSPFFGAFTSFASETIRNSANTLARGMKELGFTVPPALRQQLGEEAARALEVGMRAQGAARLTSFLTVAATAPPGAALASARTVGMTDGDVAATYQMLPPYVGGHALIFTDFDRATGRVEYVDQSLVNPYAFVTDGVRAALRAYHRAGVLGADEQNQILTGAWAGLISYAEPFGTESLVFERLRDVLPSAWVGRGGETPTGARVYGESESFGTKMQKSFNHMLGGFLPGYAREFTQPRAGEFSQGRLSRALSETPSAQGQEFNMFEEAVRLVSGYTPMVLNLQRDFHFNGLEYTALRSEARGIANGAIRAADTTPEQMAERWGNYLDDVYRHQSALYADVLAARQLGLTENQIVQQLRRRANMGAAEARAIVRGQFYATGPSTDLITDLRRDTLEDIRTRRTPTPPWQVFRELTRDMQRRPLSPQLGMESREARETSIESLLSAQAQTAAPAAPPAPMPAPPQLPAAPPTPVAGPPQTPVAPAAAPQATRAPVAPGLLGTNPMDILRNMEIVQRTGGG